MKWLTKQELTVLTVVLGLLGLGLAVKTYRTAHPRNPSGQPIRQSAQP